MFYRHTTKILRTPLPSQAMTTVPEDFPFYRYAQSCSMSSVDFELLESLSALSTLTPSHGQCDRAKNLFEIRCECFLKALSRKLSGFHVRYRFKRKPCEPRADHPSSVLTYIKHQGKSEKSVEIMDGTLTEL